MKTAYDLIIVGGGAAGMAAAISAKKKGIKRLLLLDKEEQLGSSLLGADYEVSSETHRTGESYRNEWVEQIERMDIEVRTSTTALKIEEDRVVACISGRKGIEKLKAEAVLLATGAREKGRNPLHIVGDRVSRIYTTGMARKILKTPGAVLGNHILIIGTTELERIAALLNHKIQQVVGIAASKCAQIGHFGLGGQHYEDYELAAVYGDGRVSQAVLSKGGEELTVACDAIILANPMVCDGILAMKSGIKMSEMAGPEVDSSYETSLEGVYACGRCIKPDQPMEEIIDSAEGAIEALVHKLQS